MADGPSFSIFRVITLWGTLGLVAFTLWISDGVPLGRWIAGGVLVLGFLQWLFLRRFEHQIEAKSGEELDQGDQAR